MTPSFPKNEASGHAGVIHGGRSPQVKRAARVRLEMASDRMAKELLGIATADDAPAAVKLAAIRDALDRAGLSAKTAVEIEVGPSKAYEALLTEMVEGGSRAASRAARGADDAAVPGWLEGELVEASIDEEALADADQEPLPSSPAPGASTPRASATSGAAPGSGLMDYQDLEQRIYPTFADRAVGSITTMDLVAWVTDLSLHGKRVGHNNKTANPDSVRAERDARYRERSGRTSTGKPLAPGTVHNAVRVMRQVLDAAVRARYLRGNPANGLTRDDLPRAVRDTTKTPYLTAAQVERLAESVGTVSGDDALGLLVRFAAQTGMRAGECCGLRWENVDLLRGRVTVSESISTVSNGDWTVVPPKNGKTRVVPIPPPLRDALEALATERTATGAFAPEAYVWPGPDGATTPMSWGRDFYLKWWKAAVAKAGLPAALRFHDMRHTCAALLIAANVPAKAIQIHLGHSSFKITMDTYGHLYEDASDHVANAMGAAFAAPTASEPTNVRALRG